MIQSFKMALKSISGNKMRSFLTMLGIIIGVMALVILVSLVSGTTDSVTDTINSLGNNMIGVGIVNNCGKPMRMEDLNDLMGQPEIGAAAPLASYTMTGKYKDKDEENVTVYGSTEEIFSIRNLEIMIGRSIKASDYDNHTNVCVVNEEMANKMIGYTGCLNEEITLNGEKFRIIGVLKVNKEAEISALLGGGNLEVYIPYSSYIRLANNASNNIAVFYVSPAENHTTEEAKNLLERILLERFNNNEDNFAVSSMDQIEDAMGNITAILSILLGGIAGISLVVGGIGIMNIMLVTVTERTREIGIRKAIGASRGAILRQFLIEAVVLCMIGCSIGIFLSWSFLRLVSVIVASLELSFAMNGPVVIVAVSFCFFIGVVFGLYPANKAAKMKPIDALHYSE